jgi:hypothetical protein
VEERGIAADLGIGQIQAAAEIAAIGPLDLDDSGAEIAQPQRAIGTGQELAEINDEQTVEWQIRLGHGAYFFSTWSAKAVGSR